MYLNKYNIDGEAYVKLNELNDLMDKERRGIGKTMKKNHDEGKSNTFCVGEHTAITALARKVNMSEDGEKYVIFCRDKDGKWEFLMDIVKWEQIPAFIRKHMHKTENEWATVGTNDYNEARLYDTLEAAESAIADIKQKHPSPVEWHTTKKWMFDTEKNREALLTIFYGGGKAPDAEAKDKAIEKAENAIERTRTALDKTVKLLNDIKGIVNEKPSEQPQKPPKREVRCPGRYTVWYRDGGKTTIHCMGFVRFEKGIPIFTNRPCKAMWFTWRGMAEKVAEKCGEGFEVVDMIDQMTAEERLLRAIFREDGMDGDEPCEWHGDGTKAEDEDWDGMKS